MENENQSFLFRAYHPYLQAAIVFGLILVTVIGGKLVNYFGIMEVDQQFPYLTAASFILFFIVFNSIFSLSAENMTTYWSQSMTAYIALALLSVGLAYLISSIWISDAASYRWIFIVLTFIYLIFLSIVRFMRKIVFIAQNEDRQMDEEK